MHTSESLVLQDPSLISERQPTRDRVGRIVSAAIAARAHVHVRRSAAHPLIATLGILLTGGRTTLRRFCGLLLKSYVALYAAIVATGAYAVDLESGVRNVRRYQQWTSMEFRNPKYGFFLGARASTDDMRKDATLNITATPEKERGRCSEVIEVLFKLQEPAEKDNNTDGLIEVQLDNREPKLLPSRMVVSKGDQFVFVRILRDLPASEFRGHRSILTNARGLGVAEFSLRGFSDAWKTARDTCMGFIAWNHERVHSQKAFARTARLTPSMFSGGGHRRSGEGGACIPVGRHGCQRSGHRAALQDAHAL